MLDTSEHVCLIRPRQRATSGTPQRTPRRQVGDEIGQLQDPQTVPR